MKRDQCSSDIRVARPRLRARLPILIYACWLVLSSTACSDRSTLPSALSDDEFWRLSERLSEPAGTFDVSDNLVSNEPYFVENVRRLRRTGGVYVGVGPEQNFSYIARLRPSMAFIIDIRRENRDLHLLYKALFELSDDRAEFVSRLFSKKKPETLGSRSTVQEIFDAYARVDTSDELFKRNLAEVQSHLLNKRKLPLDAEDLRGIEYVYHSFYWHGPVIQYWSSTGGRGFRDAPTYYDLMTAEDGQGRKRSYLATEEQYKVLRELHSRNLFLPVVGNFAGPKALRAVGKYLRQRDAVVSAFYLSNVEQYLTREGLIYTFCNNVAALPLDRASTFIRSVRNGMYGRGVGLDNVLGNISNEVRSCSTQR